MTKKKKSFELSLFEIQRRIIKHRDLLVPYLLFIEQDFGKGG